MKINNKILNKVLFVILLITLIFFSNNFVYANSDLEIDAKASLIVERNTGKVIYEDNSEIENYPASVTKILTAILTIENCELNDIVTVSKEAISNIPQGYVVAPLYVDEQISVKDLLYALMLKSSNDAAYVLAEHVGGSTQGFADMMNKKAKEIGCKNTHFINPNGIHDDEHYTTAYDLYLIADYSMKNKTFAKIVSTYKYTLNATNKYKYKNRVMENTNYFLNQKSSLYNKNVKGIKTGTTLQAGNCLVTNYSKDGMDYISVILGAKTKISKFTETNKMIKYSFDNYKLTTLFKKGDEIESIEVQKGTKETKDLSLVISDDITVFNNVKIKKEDMTPEITLNDEIKAPIKQGDVIGTIKVNVDDLEYEAKLLASHDVEKVTYYKEIFIGIGILLLFFIIYKMTKKSKTGGYNGISRM